MENHSVKRVLIIEDDTSMLALASRILRKDGYDVFEAMRAEQALELVAREDFHVVLTDIFMPGIGGIEAILRIHQIKPGLPVVVMSAGYGGMPGETATEAAMRVGAAAVVDKPLNAKQMLAAIATAIKGVAGNS